MAARALLLALAAAASAAGAAAQVSHPHPGECLLCTLGLTALEKLAQNADTEEQAIAVAQEACKALHLPNATEATCENDADAVVSNIFSLLKMLGSPATQILVCQHAFGVCVDDALLPLEELEAADEFPSDDPIPPVAKCGMCIRFCHATRELLAKGITGEQILEGMEQVCKMQQPKAKAKECMDTVHEVVPHAIERIAAGETPLEACQDMGICHKPGPGDIFNDF